MSRKIFCDGCDNETTYDDMAFLELRTGDEKEDLDMELCKKCSLEVKDLFKIKKKKGDK